MKKLYSVFAAGVLALLALSCVKEEHAVFDASKATAPVLVSYEQGEDAITASYTPGVFKQGFNEKMAPYHSLALVSLDGQKVSKTLTTSDKEGVLTLKNTTLAKALISLGKAEGSTASVELAVRASAQEPSKDNGRNGYVDSDGHISIASFEVVIPEVVGSPYAEYTESSTWSVIGSLSAYEIGWDGDLNMWTDGNNHVAAHVKLAAGDEFKFRQGQSWDVNMGGDFGGLDNEFSVTQDGPNIKVGADGIYDLYLNPADGIAWITAAYDPLPDYAESSNWSVIGALSLAGINWNGDIAMITNGMSKQATRHALHNVEAMRKAVGSGMEVVTTSSSCTLTIRDEYPNLLGVDNSGVRDHVLLATRFIYECLEEGARLRFKPGFRMKIAYHVPCHMERLGWGVFSEKLLRTIPGVDFTLLDSACCGIAGTYGFKKENYAASQAIGAGLFDQIRSVDPEVVACDCETCKWQIEMSTPYKVMNPVSVLAMALEDSKD